MQEREFVALCQKAFDQGQKTESCKTMIDFDLSKIPLGGRLSEIDQKEFARRAHIVDDNNDPPIIIDKDGNYIKTIDL